MMKKLQIGATLLELLGVLAVAAVIVMMAVTYFTQATMDTKLTQSVSQIQAIANASYEWLNGQKQAGFSGISMTVLVNAGLICNTAACTQHPWYSGSGSSITVAPAADVRHVLITFVNVPQKACANLVERMNRVAIPGTSANQCATVSGATNYSITL